MITEGVNFDKVAERVFQILKGHGFNLKMYQDDGSIAYDPSYEARKFYVEKHGLMVSLNREGENSEIKVYISEESDVEELRTILQLLRQTATFYGLLFNVRKYGKKLKPKDFAFLAYRAKQDEKEMSESKRNPMAKELASKKYAPKKTKTKTEKQRKKDKWDRKGKYKKEVETMETVEVFESKDTTGLWGSKKSSYQKVGGPAKMIVRHKKAVDEDKFAARSRNIGKIFVETHEGERLKFPTNWLQGARAMTRHISEGGDWNDDIGNYIKNVSEEYRNLRRFARHAGRNLNEEASEVVDTVKSRTKEIATEMKRIQGPNSYKKFSENFEESNKEAILGEDHLAVELNRINGLFQFNEEFDGMEEAINTVATLTSNREKVNELKDDRSLEQKVRDIVEKGDLEFFDIKKEEPDVKFPDKSARIAYKLRDLSGRVKNDEVSVYLSRIVDQIDNGEPIEKSDIKLVAEIIKMANHSPDFTPDEQKKKEDLYMESFMEWINQFDPDKILLGEKEVETPKKMKDHERSVVGHEKQPKPEKNKKNGISSEMEKKGKVNETNIIEINRLRELAGMDPLQEEPYLRDHPYDSEPEDYDVEQAYEYANDEIDVLVQKSIAGYERPVIDEELYDELISSARKIGIDTAEEMLSNPDYFNEDVIDDMVNKALKKHGIKVSNLGENFPVEDEDEFRDDLQTEPGIRQKMKDNPKKVIDKYQRKQ